MDVAPHVGGLTLFGKPSPSLRENITKVLESYGTSLEDMQVTVAPTKVGELIEIEIIGFKKEAHDEPIDDGTAGGEGRESCPDPGPVVKRAPTTYDEGGRLFD